MKARSALAARFVACLLLAGPLVACADSLPVSAPSDPARPPLVDLSQIDFSDDRVYIVPTRWDFYWRRFLDARDFLAPGAPPAFRVAGMQPWTEIDAPAEALPAAGYGTYRMLLRLPAGRVYGFRIQHQFTAFRLYVDGELKVTGGEPGTAPAQTRPDRANHSFYVRADAPELEIIVQVANFHGFRGGLRGFLALGERVAIERYTWQKIALDIGLFGFFLAVFLYHLAFYLMHPRESSFLFFALFCLNSLIRVPLVSEKFVTLLFPVSWVWFMGSLAWLNILAPLLIIALLRSVFPDSVSRRMVAAYTLVSLPFLITFVLDLKYQQPAILVWLLIVLVPLLSHSAFITIKMALSGSSSALLMALGIFAAIFSAWYALYLNWQALDAAPVALFGFAGFTLFNALALGRRYQENLAAREVLHEGLERSRSALAAQRRDLEMNLHDSLGGALTDFKMLIETGLEQAARQKSDFDAAGWFQKLSLRLDRTNRTFRGQLLFMEDLELTVRDPVIGLRMILLRRYTDAGRELEFDFAPEGVEPFRRAMADDGWRINLLQLTREMCTNDLKYGTGESHWSFAIRQEDRSRQLEIRQSNLLAEPSPAGPEKQTGGMAEQRARIMKGRLRIEVQEKRYCVLACLPFPKE